MTDWNLRWATVRTLLLAAGMFVVMIAIGGCDAREAEAPDPALQGLVLVEGGVLRAWVGPDASSLSLVDIPGVSGVVSIAGSPDGRLVAITDTNEIKVSNALSSHSQILEPTWTEVNLVDAEGHDVAGPYESPVWDPSGDRFSVLASPDDSTSRLVVVDPDDARAELTVSLDAATRPRLPTWIGPNRVAIQLGAPNTGALPMGRANLVDTVSGQIEDGPNRGAWASSPDGSLVLTSAGPTNGPFSVVRAESWLSGARTVVAELAEPPSAGAIGMVFDQRGERIVISRSSVADVGEERFETIYADSAAWAAIGSTPGRKRSDPVGVAWLP